jgi:hypothetical protein
MARLAAHGIRVDLPAGWDGRITVRRGGEPEGFVGADGFTAFTAVPQPVLHVASFGLPEERGDFGGGAVDLMGDQDVFLVLFEFDPEAARTALFASHGFPRSIPPAAYSRNTLRTWIAGQSGHQAFFQDEGRAFTLYVVLGSHARRNRLSPRVDALLATISIEPRGSGSIAR